MCDLYLPLLSIARFRGAWSNSTLCQRFSIAEDTLVHTRLSGVGLAQSDTYRLTNQTENGQKDRRGNAAASALRSGRWWRSRRDARRWYVTR